MIRWTLRALLPLLMLFGTAAAQAPIDGAAAVDLRAVGTWTLLTIEEGVESRPTQVPSPRGLLVIDAAGHVFEAITRANRQQPTPENAELSDAQRVFATYAGFWGRYRIDAGSATMKLLPLGALSPSVMGREIERDYAFDDGRLVVTSRPGEPHVRAATRWTWERSPVVEKLTPEHRQILGFWQHEAERRVNLSLGTSRPGNRRAPSVIVYTPSGHVGVQFPPLDRTPFAGAEPTDAEARAALRDYVGYFGTSAVDPGTVLHRVQAGVSPVGGTTLERFISIVGDQAHLRFPVAINARGQRTTTDVTLRRLSGADEMLGVPREQPVARVPASELVSAGRLRLARNPE